MDSTNLLTLNNEPFPSSTQQQQQQPSSSPDAKQISKLILRSALQKANAAVQCDSTNDVLGAIEAYKEAILLLERVLATVDKENDRRRLQEIHDSYSERIRLLSTITSKLENEVLNQPVHNISNEQEEELDEGDDELDDEEEDNDKSWLASKPNTYMIKKMSSSSSIDSYSRNHWQDNTTSINRFNSIQQQKESKLLPVSPPNQLQLQASKSTPTKSKFNQEEAFDLEKDELNLLGQHESPSPSQTVIKRPPRNSSRIIIKKQPSNRSSISSMHSATSSIESSENSSIVEQPPMALPPLLMKNKKEVEDTPSSSKKPSPSSNFRARTSSLPKSAPPLLMQRSSSISTMDVSGNNEAPVTPVEAEKPIEHSQQSSPPAPPPLIINRPIVSRPSVGGGLGSMRKKAANRLSMDGFVNRNKSIIATPNSSGPIYGLFLKDQIQSATVNDMDYMMDNRDTIYSNNNNQQDNHHNYQQQQFNHSMMDDDMLDENQQQQSNSHLKLLLALEKSMLEGAHITQKLYIPKNLWQQPNIRLSSMDIKVSACESLLNDISRLENWSYLDDLVSSTRLLENFESSVDQLQTSLSKKLKRESHVVVENNSGGSSNSSNGSSNSSGNNASSPSSISSTSIMSNSSSNTMIHNNSRDSMSTIGRTDSGKKTQSFMSWGTKLTKSVERMNAFSLTKTNSEDQYRHYIEVLQKLFNKIHTLESWLNHYSIEKRKSRQPQHDVLIMKLIKICTVINNVVGGFVVRDITVLLAKWLKRGGTWVNE